MATVSVSTSDQLLTALRSAAAGDRIELADGDYGSLALNGIYQGALGAFAGLVTIASARPGGAVCGVELRHAANVAFEGVEIAGDFRSAFSENIALTDSAARAVFLREDRNVTLERNHIVPQDGLVAETPGSDNALSLYSVQGFTIRENILERAERDLIQISRNSSGGLIENNVLNDVVVIDPTAHPDMIQIYGIDGETPHDIVIRGNHLYDDPATGLVLAQGVYIANPQSAQGFRDITVAENLISVRHVNSIYIDGGQENVLIRDNTLIAGPEGHRGGTLRLASWHGYDNAGVTAEGNLLRNVIDETEAATLRGNYLYQTPEQAAAIFAGNGSAWQHFLIADTVLSSTYGANRTLARMMEETAPAATGGSDVLLGRPETSTEPAPVHAVLTAPDLLLSGNIAPDARFTGGRIDTIQRFADTPALALEEGTIALTFNADTVNWRRGIFSKDSAGTGHGLSAWFEDGALKIRFEGGAKSDILSVSGLHERQDHALQISFGAGRGQVWIDGALMGEVATGMDWRANGDDLILGADNSQSASGSIAKLRYAFDGRIEDFGLYDRAMTPAELQALLSGGDMLL